MAVFSGPGQPTAERRVRLARDNDGPSWWLQQQRRPIVVAQERGSGRARPGSAVRGTRSEVRGGQVRVRGTRSEVRGTRSEVRGGQVRVRGTRSEVRGGQAQVRPGPCGAVESRSTSLV